MKKAFLKVPLFFAFLIIASGIYTINRTSYDGNYDLKLYGGIGLIIVGAIVAIIAFADGFRGNQGVNEDNL